MNDRDDVNRLFPMVPDLIEDNLPEGLVMTTKCSNCGLSGNLPCGCTESINEIEMQQVWRTMSKSENSGYFVWDVLQVVGDTDRIHYFELCRDGSYILIHCFHFWTKKAAEVFLDENRMPSYQTVEIIA